MASMMDCNKVQPLLSEYVDGALVGDAAWDVKLHLSSCAVCSRIVDDFTATTRLLGTLDRQEPSVDFEAALARRLADQALQARPLSVWQRLARWWSDHDGARRPALASAAALAAVLPLAVVIASQQQRSAPTTPSVVVSSASPSTPSDDAALRAIIDDHTEFSSSLPLGDPADLLTASDTGL